MYTYIVYYYSLIFQNKKGDLQKVSHQFGADDRLEMSIGHFWCVILSNQTHKTE